eukprot:GHVS01032831.1.p1 GENE.GHVS01032831.1~~GHVS01032831.1.p1  ORF type:complete len:612 (+),score=106.08 GHVS01032831.1:272-2107(+)
MAASSTSCGGAILSKHTSRNAYVDTALHVLKGALCTALQLPTGRSTQSVKFAKDMKGVLTVGPVKAEPTEEEQRLISELIRQKIAENMPLRVFSLNRSMAEKMYGDCIYDEFGVPKTIQKLRLVVLEEWNINANVFPVLRSTAMLGAVEVSKYKFTEEKQTLGVHFTVHPPEIDLTEEEGLVEQEDGDMHIDRLPRLAQVLPPSGVSEDVSVDDSGQKVTPWEVQGGEKGIDYDKLIRDFGCAAITQHQIQRIEALTGQRAHRFLRRGLFFSHRDLNLILDSVERKQPFYLYTGKGPSSESLHLGHLVPFMFTKYLQDAFDVPLVIQLTDDEKFLFKKGISLKDAYRLGYENTKDIIACGFDVNKTFVFSDLDYIKQLYPVILSIQEKVTYSQSRSIFGFTESDNIGKSAFPAVQAAPAFSHSFPTLFPPEAKVRCLIPQAIDQDPYFRMTREVAPRLGLLKPALIHCRFIPSLQGYNSKMSGSVEVSSVFVTDDEHTVKNKIMKYAFSGGQATTAEHRAKGADLSVDVAYLYLTFLLDDDEQLEDIGRRYRSGEMLTGEVKEVLIKTLNELFLDHQTKRNAVTDEMVRTFMDPNRSCLMQQQQQEVTADP